MPRTLLLPLVIGPLLIAACGSRSPSRDDVIDDLAVLVGDDRIPEDERVCVATRLVDDLGIDVARRLPAEARKRVVDPDLRVTVADAYRACDVIPILLDEPAG